MDFPCGTLLRGWVPETLAEEESILAVRKCTVCVGDSRTHCSLLAHKKPNQGVMRAGKTTGENPGNKN